MDLRLAAIAFGTVFVAELGDKTQLAALALAADGRSKLAVFAGASLALVVTTALAVLAGDLLARWIPPRALHRGAGGLFILLGAWMLLHPAADAASNDRAPADATNPRGE